MALNRWLAGLGDGARSLVTNASYLTAAALLTYVVRAVYILVVARALGPELYGLLAYGQSWYVTFLPLAIFGVGSVLGREFGHGGAGARPVVEASLALRLVTVAAAASLCLTVGWWGATSPEQRSLLAVFSVALLGRGVAFWAQNVFVAAEQARLALRQERLFRPLEAMIGVGLVYLGHGVSSLAILHAGVWWLQALQGVGLVRTQLFPVAPRWDRARLLALAMSGAPIALGGALAGWLVTGPLILYARQAGATPELVGQLALPMQICAVLYGLMVSASNAAVPILSRSIARGDGKDVVFLRATAVGAQLIGSAGSLLGACGGPWFMGTLFGQRYAEAGDILAAAIALLIPLTVGSAAVQVLIARRRNLGLIVSASLGAAAFSATLPLLVSRLGPLGAIAAAGIGAALWVAVALRLALRAGRVQNS